MSCENAPAFLRSKLTLSVFLFLAVFCLFSRVIPFGFSSIDDPVYILHNEHVNSGLSIANTYWALTSFENANWHPATWIAHQIDCSLYGLHASGHHISNLIIHGLNAVLCFILLQRLSGRLWASYITAFLFAVNPLRVESVAWISERKDLLSSFCLFLLLLYYTDFLTSGKRKDYYISLFWGIIGLMAKPMLVTLPVILLVFDIIYHYKLERPLNFKEVFLTKIPFALMAGITTVFTITAQALSGATGQTHGSHIKLILSNYVTYIKQIIFPERLSIFYHFEQHSWLQVSGFLLILTAISLYALLCVQIRPYLLPAWSLFLIVLLPVIGFMSAGLSPSADRYTYLASIGLLVMFVFPLIGCQMRLISWVILPIAVCWCCLTWQREALWKNTHMLMTDMLQHDTGYTKDLYMGAEYYREKDFKKAEILFKHAIQLCHEVDPGLESYARVYLAQMYTQENRRAEAIAEYEWLIRENPKEDLILALYTLKGRQLNRKESKH